MRQKTNFGGILVASTLAILIAIVAGYFGPQTVTYARLRSILRRSNDAPPRGWSSAPSALKESEVSSAAGRVILRPGYRFEVPWNEIKTERGDDRIEFQSGQRLTFGDRWTSEIDPINPQNLHFETREFARLFGTQKRESKYEQFREVVSAVPSGLSPFRSRTEFRRYESLLEAKGVWFEHNVAAPDIWSFQTKDCHGFEVSGLRRGWENVTLNLFDSEDHRFVINIQGDEQRGVEVSQPEINRVIQSFAAAPVRD